MHYLGKCHFNWVTHSLEFQECGVFFIYFVSCLIAVFSKTSRVFQIDRKNTLFSAEMGFTEKQVLLFKGRNFDIDCEKDGNGKNNFFHANFWLPNSKKNIPSKLCKSNRPSVVLCTLIDRGYMND